MYKQKYFFTMGLLIWLFSLLSIFLINSQLTFIVLLFITNLVYLFLILKYSVKFSLLTKFRLFLAILTQTTIATYFITNLYTFFLIFLFSCFIIGALEFSTKFKNSRGLRILLFPIFILFLFTSFFLGINSINPDYFVNFLHNEPSTQISTITSFDEKYFRTNDIKYSNVYPNSYFDLYNNTKDIKELKPVFIFLHGGGWVFGDKLDNEPEIATESGFADFLETPIEAGYIVISVNYALAPEYKYPTPLYQLNQLMTFLKNNGTKYGIDSNTIVIAGNSAGAQLVGQFTAIQTNDQYAKELNIDQTLLGNEIKGLYLSSGLLVPTNTASTNVFTTNYLFYQLARSYFNADSLAKNVNVHEANFTNYITMDFPTTYITDGNYGTYNVQARQFEETLRIKGVKYSSFILDNAKEHVPHSYDLENSHYAELNRLKFAKFLQDIDYK